MLDLEVRNTDTWKHEILFILIFFVGFKLRQMQICFVILFDF